MRTSIIAALAVMLSAATQAESAGNAKVVRDQHSAVGVKAADPGGSLRTQHPGAQWFPEAGLGLFICPGISSVEGKHEMSWAMISKINWNPNPMTPEDYFALSNLWKPDNYHPEKWLKAAKEAGVTYTIFVTKHHDGYACWPSKYGDFNTATRIDGRDMVKPFVDACRKVGIKVGFYYSPPDWWYTRKYMSFGYGTKGTPESPHLGLGHEPVQLPPKPAGFDRSYAAYINGQLTELLTNYGCVDLLWFDGSVPGVMSQKELRKLQPAIVINDRQHGTGDFVTKLYEGSLPASRPPDGWWECCMSMVGPWGYTTPEICNPTSLLLSRVVRCMSWGGNLAASFAPRPDGEMPDKFYQCMRETKGWMAVNGASIRGVKPGPYPEQSNVPVTVRGRTWYLHLLPLSVDTPRSDGEVRLTGVGKPKWVRLLRTGEALNYVTDANGIHLNVPKEKRTDLVDVIAVRWR